MSEEDLNVEVISLALALYEADVIPEMKKCEIQEQKNICGEKNATSYDAIHYLLPIARHYIMTGELKGLDAQPDDGDGIKFVGHDGKEYIKDSTVKSGKRYL